MAGEATKAVRLLIRGDVQGVWFRGWTVDTARALGLRGWVRNCRDGRVEALVAGPEGPVDQLVAACREGPPAAHVTDVEITSASEDDAGPGPFEQRGTA